jgi:hypothetical protein
MIMADLGALTGTKITPNCGIKVISVTTNAAPQHADTLTVDLKKHGCTLLMGVLGARETTAGQVVVLDQPILTAVASGVATITIPSGADSKIRNYLIFAY